VSMLLGKSLAFSRCCHGSDTLNTQNYPVGWLDRAQPIEPDTMRAFPSLGSGMFRPWGNVADTPPSVGPVVEKCARSKKIVI